MDEKENSWFQMRGQFFKDVDLVEATVDKKNRIKP